MMRVGRQLPVVSRLREERGFTLVEVLVATVILAIALLGLFGALDLANRADYVNRERQAATSLTREVVEQVRSLPYTQLNPSTLATDLQPLIPNATVSGQGLTVTQPASGGPGTPTAGSAPYVFSVSFTACSEDDPSDGTGDHGPPPASGGSWCADVGPSGTTDSQPDDYKRVSVTVNQTGPRTTSPVQQTVAIYNRPTNGPAISCLTVTGFGCPGTATGVYQQTTTSLTFDVTTTSPASAIQWTVNGNPPPANEIPAGAGDPYTLSYGTTSSQFTWVLPAADGTYTIGATAIDMNGNSGTVGSLQITVNRHMVIAPSSFWAIYNAFIGGYEVQWVPSIDQDVVYYRVFHTYNGVTTQVCQVPGTATSCTDMSAGSLADTPPAMPPGCTYSTANGPANTYWVVGVDYNIPPNQTQLRQSTALSPTANANACENAPSHPNGLSGSAPVNQVINLTWTAPTSPTDADPGDSVQAWRVYRWPQGTPFPGPGSARLSDRLQLVGSGNNMSVTSATDNAADPGGVPQNYCVTAIDVQVNESQCSNTWTG
jgi:prepilin-type N-terminal cleavage/methylation domain-containing protein